MGRFDELLQRFIPWAQGEAQIYSAVVLGSQAREERPADPFSDLDILMVVERPSRFLKEDQWLQDIGPYWLSFVEDTLGGGRERRVLFDGSRDVDFVLFSLEELKRAFPAIGPQVLGRGWKVLVDKIDLTALLRQTTEMPEQAVFPAGSFHNLVNDFWYHALWSAKKIGRGEWWTAKTCVDGYLKMRLLTAVEQYEKALHGATYDTWHNGRFIEDWAEGWIIEALTGCYAHYDQEEIPKALLATMNLFRKVAKHLAEEMGTWYPEQSDSYVDRLVRQILTAGNPER